jgi:hypothetical protein
LFGQFDQQDRVNIGFKLGFWSKTALKGVNY